MRLFLQKHHRFLFYSIWLLLALTQSASTELIADEAYYWVYSRFPAWGYFDHPPMISMVIKWGYSIFQNELGVRLICALFSLFTVIIAELLTDKKNPILFYTIVLSIGALQIAGFLAVPDTPLLFFTALFFYCYRQYIANISLRTALLLGIAVVFLFYTKYHGLLIVFFTLLSNLKLLGRWQTWFAGLVVLIFFAPHLYWQWENDWVSFRYHLFESNVSPYQISNTTDYLLGQLLLAGPLVSIILLPASLLFKPKTDIEKALKFTLIGIYIFFFISSFRGKVEANWTMPVLIPLIVLSYQYLISKNSWLSPLRILALVSLVLIMAGRIYLVQDLGPDNMIKSKFHNHKKWAKAIAEKTKNIPVVFYSSYQRSSLYWFYSGIPSHSHNAWQERSNNYNFWPTESNLLGKKIFFADIYNISGYKDSLKTKTGWVGFSPDTTYAGLAGIKIIPEQKKIESKFNSLLKISFGIITSEPYTQFLQHSPDLKTELLAGIFKGKNIIKEFGTGISAHQLVASANLIVELDLESISPGDYDLRFSIRSKDYPPTHNSHKIKLQIR